MATEVEINVGDRFIMKAGFQDLWDRPTDPAGDFVVTSIMGDYVEYKELELFDPDFPVFSEFALRRLFLREFELQEKANA